MALETGSRLGPYEILAPLGAGGMSEVYRARDPRLGREVAIKVLREDVADESRLRRFEQEARAAGSLNHPNVLAVYDVGTHEGAPYVVSELLEGQTLRARLEDGALPVKKAVAYGLQIAHGLAAAHDRGIVHRDLKPDNVLVTDDGRVKILDFGLAKLTRPEALTPAEHTATEMTGAGVVLGTIGFMSPEQVRGEEVDHRSDIFSFGVVLYEMLTGQRAFHQATAAETMAAILKEDPLDAASLRPGMAPGLGRIVERCLEKRAADRFHSAHDLSLALEATSTGLVRPDIMAADPPTMPARGRGVHPSAARLAALAAVGLVALGVYWLYARSRVSPGPAAIESLAVLPFENVGGDPDSDYLSDGLAENLINRLSQLSTLKVIARAAAFRFRGKDLDPQQVGHALGVGAVVTGHVTRRGDTVVVGVELVDVVEGTQLWGERYDSPMRNILGLEESLASEIARGLRLRITPRSEALLAKRHTENGEAYRLYLLSQYELNKATLTGPRRAHDYAQQATETDPAYAPAWALLARAHIALAGTIQMNTREAVSRAKAAARKAIEIEQTLAEGHAALARALDADWDWAGAEREYRRALELNPNSHPAHSTYGSFLAHMGRWEQAIEHMTRAIELAPDSVEDLTNLSMCFALAGRYDEALRRFQAAVELEPASTRFFFWRAFIYRETGRYEEAITEFKSIADAQNSAALLAHLGNTYGRSGRREEALDCLRRVEQLVKSEAVGNYEMALIHTGLGESDQALEWLQRAFDEREWSMVFLRVDPTLDPLRSDVRFEDLVVRMRFPE